MAKTSNINAIISFGQQISGTLQNIQQLRWQFALSKAKMSRDERIRQDEMTFARKAATTLAQQKQAEAKAKEQAHSENLLGRLLQKLNLNVSQQQQVLAGQPIEGEIKTRPTEHVSTTFGGRERGLQDPRRIIGAKIFQQQRKGETFEDFLVRIQKPEEEGGLPESAKSLQLLLRSQNMFDLIMQMMNPGQGQQLPPPPGS